MGPTAAGKTREAMRLAERFPVELISVDSAMVYRRMDIGSGKPTAAELARSPHRLIDIREPHDTFSAADFSHAARHEIVDIVSQGRIPLLVGGTGLYYRALEEGLSVLPSANAEVRARLTAWAAEAGWPALHTALQRIDPERARAIHPPRCPAHTAGARDRRAYRFPTKRASESTTRPIA